MIALHKIIPTQLEVGVRVRLLAFEINATGTIIRHESPFWVVRADNNTIDWWLAPKEMEIIG